MNTTQTKMRSGFLALCAIGMGYLSWRFAPLKSWAVAFPSLLTALSLMGGAVLVRLARNAPITSPATFNDEDLKRFFDSLESLSVRLLWIFVQTMGAMFFTISSIVLESIKIKPDFVVRYIEPVLSGMLAVMLIWLVWRLFLMARGDIGFLRLQRQILENAMKREKKKEIEKLLDESVISKSSGLYGRRADQPESL